MSDKRDKIDKKKIWTRVVALILAVLMVLGFGITLIMALATS